MVGIGVRARNDWSIDILLPDGYLSTIPVLVGMTCNESRSAGNPTEN
jgi:hypothetical protein